MQMSKIVYPAKYYRVILDDTVEKHLKQVCLGIELRYNYIQFLEISTDSDCVHFLVQSTPDYVPSKFVKSGGNKILSINSYI